jgi:hypothetical protein
MTVLVAGASLTMFRAPGCGDYERLSGGDRNNGKAALEKLQSDITCCEKKALAMDRLRPVRARVGDKCMFVSVDQK